MRFRKYKAVVKSLGLCECSGLSNMSHLLLIQGWLVKIFLMLVSPGWPRRDPALPLPWQRPSRLQEGGPGQRRNLRPAERVGRLSQPLRGHLPVQVHPSGGQPQRRHQLLVPGGHRVHRSVSDLWECVCIMWRAAMFMFCFVLCGFYTAWWK